MHSGSEKFWSNLDESFLFNQWTQSVVYANNACTVFVISFYPFYIKFIANSLI